MTQVYEISTIEQIAELTPAQQKGFIQDLSAWLEFANMSDVLHKAGVSFDKSTMQWKDDGNWGQVSEVVVKLAP